MLLDWSKKSSEDEFQTFPTVDAAKEKEACKWLKDLNRNSLLHWYETFDDFSRWLYAALIVTLPMMCSCRTNLKTYVCKHAIGVSIHFASYIIYDPSKLEDLGKRRGRPKKAGPALSR